MWVSWRRLVNLVAWLPPDSWWFRMDNPQLHTAAGGRGRPGRVIDARSRPHDAASFFDGLKPGKNKRRKAAA